jgi:hypothetical protein
MKLDLAHHVWGGSLFMCANKRAQETARLAAEYPASGGVIPIPAVAAVDATEAPEQVVKYFGTSDALSGTGHHGAAHACSMVMETTFLPVQP